jgi:hypothetical protein
MKTTTKQFELFKKEARSWIKALGLVEYEVHFGHEELENLAECGINEQARLCKIFLSKEWDSENVPLTNEEVKKAAFHEVLELLFGRIRRIAELREGTPDSIDGEIHRLIQTFINVLYQ